MPWNGWRRNTSSAAGASDRMAYSVHITRRALREIDEALGWLNERSRPAALRWYKRILEAIRGLERNPQRREVAPESEWYGEGLRQLLQGKRQGVYRILFEVRGDTVHIL